jgi:hypothetical protein
MSQSLSNLLAAWLIAALCIGSVSLLREPIQRAVAIDRTDPAIPAGVRPVPRQYLPDLTYGRTDHEEMMPGMP